MNNIEYLEKPPTLEEYNLLRKHVGWHAFTDLNAVQNGLDNSLFHVTARKGK